METTWKEATRRQVGAAIDMLENAITACPGDLWAERSREPEYWYLAYHTLFWLDLYLSDSFEDFLPPAPFTLSELDPAGILPEGVYSKEELLIYLEHCRRKCRTAVEAMTPEKAARPHRYGAVEGSGAEFLLYNLRHVQHGAAQLNLILRQTIDSAPRWVLRAKNGGNGRGKGAGQ